MPSSSEDRMRAYWDERARLNAPWYVDTSLDYNDPDMQKFWESGEKIVSVALGDAPFEPPAYDVAVEIGCGLGRVCRALADRFAHVVGIDVAPEMIARARELVRDERIEFVVGGGSRLDGVPDGSVDAVVSFTVFQHIPDVGVIAQYIADAGRALRPGGLFSFQWNNTPGSRTWSIRRRLLQVLHPLGIGRKAYGTNDPAFLGSRVPLKVIRQALASGGMELVHVERPGELFAWAWARKLP